MVLPGLTTTSIPALAAAEASSSTTCEAATPFGLGATGECTEYGTSELADESAFETGASADVTAFGSADAADATTFRWGKSKFTTFCTPPKTHIRPLPVAAYSKRICVILFKQKQRIKRRKHDTYQHLAIKSSTTSSCTTVWYEETTDVLIPFETLI